MLMMIIDWKYHYTDDDNDNDDDDVGNYDGDDIDRK